MANDWRHRAACKDEDPELFFPVPRGGKWAHEYIAQVEVALSVCGRCPVSAECLLFAMETNAEGVWGNSTEDERKALKAEESAA
jgi:WhiB family redox-sensing transcriptional regulator